MKNNYLLFFIIALFLVMSCKKEPLPGLPDGNDPIYTMNGIIDEDTLALKVGLQNVKINYGVEDEFGVLSYFGEMESVLDNEIIRVEILRQELPWVGNEVEVFKSNQIPFLVHEKGTALFDFGGVGNQLNNFQIQDGNGYFVNINELELPHFGIHTIKAKIEDYGQEIFQFQVKHGFEDRNLIAGYNVQGTANEIYLDAHSNTFKHEWYINNQLVSTDSNYVGAVQDGVYEIVHRVYDKEGNVSSASGLVRIKGGKNFWDMKVNFSESEPFERYNFGRIIVSYKKDDQWYSSSYGMGNKHQMVNVSDASIFYDDETNEKLMSFNIDFSAVVYTADLSDSLSLNNMNGKFLIGLPQRY